MNQLFLAMQAGPMCPMCDRMAGMGPWGMLLIALFWILLLGVAGWIVYRLVRGWSRGARSRDAERMLRERYARGEIDRETYERMRDDLRS
jgi:putative membrane protein